MTTATQLRSQGQADVIAADVAARTDEGVGMTCTHCGKPIDRNRETWEHVYGDSRDCWGQFCYAPGDNPNTDPARTATPTP